METLKQIAQDIRDDEQTWRLYEERNRIQEWNLDGFVKFLEASEEEHLSMDVNYLKNVWSACVSLTIPKILDEETYKSLASYLVSLRQKRKK